MVELMEVMLSGAGGGLAAVGVMALLVAVQDKEALLGGGAYHFEDAADGCYPVHERKHAASPPMSSPASGCII